MGGGGKGYKQNQKYFQQKATSSSTTFLPILCSRLSIEDVVRVPNKSQWQEVIDEEDNNRSVSVSVSGSFSSTNTEDPLSPKIGCMGQVKRSNKIVGFPSSSFSSSFSSSNNNISSSSKQQLFLISTKNVGIITSTSAVIKYSKLKKMFSSKNLTAAPTNATTTTASSTRSRGFIRDSRHHHHHHHRGSSSSSSTGVIKNIIGEMDPPLPVIIKKVQKAEGDDAENSLWKRRSGGRKASLQNLQLHNITSSLQNLAPTTV